MQNFEKYPTWIEENKTEKDKIFVLKKNANLLSLLLISFVIFEIMMVGGGLCVDTLENEHEKYTYQETKKPRKGSRSY